MRLFLCTLGWVSCAFFTLPTLTSAPSTIAHAQDKGDRPKRGKKLNIKKCVRFSQELGNDEESVNLKLTNHCREPVVCSIEWKVACTNDGEEASIASSSKRSTTLDPAQSLELNASASSCEQDWSIEDVGWNCAPL